MLGVMRRALTAVVVTVAAVVLVANFKTRPTGPPRPVRTPAPSPDAASTATPALKPVRKSVVAHPGKGRVRSANGLLIATPYLAIQVRATLTGNRLTGVETVTLTGDGAHTQALNARAEPILRAEALKAGSAHIDVVSGATGTSQSYIQSLQSAIDRARRR